MTGDSNIDAAIALVFAAFRDQSGLLSPSVDNVVSVLGDRDADARQTSHSAANFGSPDPQRTTQFSLSKCMSIIPIRFMAFILTYFMISVTLVVERS